MKIDIIFTPTSWEQYQEWLIKDKRIYTKIFQLIKDIATNGPLDGIGKPEKLKGNDTFSRRINDEHRLVYKMSEEGNLIIISCMYHYEK